MLQDKEEDMKLSDIIDDEYKAEKAGRISEEINDLVRNGLDRYEKAFATKFVEIVGQRNRDIGVTSNLLVFRDYSLGEECDKFLKRQLKSQKESREQYYNINPQCRPKSNEDKTQMPPLEMVPSLVYISALKILFAGLEDLEKIEMSSMFGLEIEEMVKIFGHFHKVRNKCSHNQNQNRLSEFAFCMRKFSGPSDIRITYRGKTEFFDLDNSLFGTMTLLGHMLSNLPYSKMSLSAGEWRYKMATQFSIMPEIVLTEMGFPSEWKDHRIWRKSNRKSIQQTSMLHGTDSDIFSDIYGGASDDQKNQIDRRVQLISSKLIERGWDTHGSGMDNYECTAKVCVMRSVLGFEDDGYGFPMHEFNFAKVMANGSGDTDELLNVLNDFYSYRIFNDSIWTYIPKGASDEIILEKIDRWMSFDKKRRESDFHKSILMHSTIVRKGGSIISVEDICPAFAPSFVNDIADEMSHDYHGDFAGFIKHMHDNSDDHIDRIPEWMRVEKSEKSENHARNLYNVCRHALVTKIGENGIKRIIYNSEFGDTFLWPEEITIDLNEARSDFKDEIEKGYKFQDPKAIGCKPYDAPFVYPFMLEADVPGKLQEKKSRKNPFASVDSALCYAFTYYCSIIKKKVVKKAESIRSPKEVSMQPICMELIEERKLTSKRYLMAKFRAAIYIGGVCVFEQDLDMSIELYDINGGLKLNTTKVHRSSENEAEKIAKKVVKKIGKRSSR